MALRRFSMDYVCWRTFDGRAYACCRDVPVVAPSDAFGCVVPEYCHVGFARRILWARDYTVDLLHHHRSHSKPWNLDFPSIIRRRWCCESYFFFCVLYLWFLGVWCRLSRSFRFGSGMFQRRKLGRRRRQRLPLVQILRSSLLIMVGLLLRRSVMSPKSNRVLGVDQHESRKFQMWIHNRIVAWL